jgi:hypothetical protein
MKQYFYTLLCVCLVGVAVAYSVSPQMTDTCADGKGVVMDVTNKRYKCMAPNVPLVYRLTTLNVNQTNTDVGTFSNLPSKYIVRRLTFDNASATPTLSTVSLRTATGGGGTAIVNAQALSSLSATTTFVDSTLAVTTTVQTASSLVVRAVAAAGGAATVDATLEITPLP